MHANEFLGLFFLFGGNSCRRYTQQRGRALMRQIVKHSTSNVKSRQIPADAIEHWYTCKHIVASQLRVVVLVEERAG